MTSTTITQQFYNLIPEFGCKTPCIPGDTWIFTTNGSYKINELIGKHFIALVNGVGHQCIN